MEVLWPMDRAVDGGERQQGPELGPAAALTSTPGSRAQAPVDGGFLDLCHKTKLVDGG